MGKPVLFETKEGIAMITLNRPEKRNAINREFLIHFYNCLDEVSSNDKIRVAIITGNGKSFCAGLDLSVIKTENLFDPRGDGKDLPDVFEDCKKPIIGAINGHAITGGFEIALNCDFLIASEHACFADTHAKVGIHPGWGMTQLLQQAVGQRMAKQISFTCQFVSAQKAMQCGLVNEVVPHGELISRAKQISTEICAVNQEMLGVVKDLIKYKNHVTRQESLAHERKGFRKFVGKFLKHSKANTV
ncbi:MAG: enoyl-CoA hydratase [Desulfobacula sp.]|uniref:enoyl-CoA hydratase n=1 Tax=Desulfobacula sp. TaxID=2593537 RepID=UPI0025C2B11C|nr:enoyl-CoA hydratase [Desulfobacula sp.]MCD4721603.1 enoyl-CoA hydratase [Desulfobacula sp.]